MAFNHPKDPVLNLAYPPKGYKEHLDKLAKSKALKKKVEVKDRFTKSTLFNTRHSRDFVRKLEKGKKINPH